MKTYTYDDEYGAGDTITLTTSADWVAPPNEIECEDASELSMMFYIREDEDD